MNPSRQKETPSCTSSEELNKSWLVVDQRKAWEKETCTNERKKGGFFGRATQRYSFRYYTKLICVII